MPKKIMDYRYLFVLLIPILFLFLFSSEGFSNISDIFGSDEVEEQVEKEVKVKVKGFSKPKFMEVSKESVEIPPSSQKEFTTLKNLGKDVYLQEGYPLLEDDNVNKKPMGNMITESTLPAFDPSRGGLTKEQKTSELLNTVINTSNELRTNDASEAVFPSNFEDKYAMIDDFESRDVKSPSVSPSVKTDDTKGSSDKSLNLKMIYHPGCGHCKKAMPAFDKLISDKNNTEINGYKIKVSKHDNNEKALLEKYNVTGFPTYKLETPSGVKDVKVRDYDGLFNVLKKNAV